MPWPLTINGQDTSTLNLDEIQALFYQIIALLGLSMAVYLYINFRNNKKRSSSTRAIHTPTDEATSISKQLQQLINLIPYAACIANENQKVVYYNEQYKNLVTHKALDNHQSWDKQLLIDKSQINLSNNGEFIATNKGLKTFKLNIKPIDYKKLGLTLYSVIIEDISHLQDLQDDIEKRKGYLKNTIANASFPVIIIDEDLNIFESNKHFYNIIKSKRNKLTQEPLINYFPEDEREIIRQHLTNGLNNENKQQVFHLSTSDKQSIPVELNVIPFNFFGSTSTICFFKDISERQHMEKEILKAKQQAEESDRLKSSFLANMSHEVRTPLNSIMGFTELMSDEQLKAHERKEFHNIVKASSSELLNLLNDIMEFSKIESGLIQLDYSKIIPHDIVSELRDYASSQTTNNEHLDIIIKEPVGLGDMPDLKSDKKRIKQVLRHLIDNAIKFTYNGTITLSYQYRLDNSVEFIVSDTGIGIPHKKIPNIFHKFRQANDDNSRDFGGAGLGLSICKHLANVLGGFLWVSSIENHGSEFHFILPSQNDSSQNYRYNNAIIFYSNTPQPAPVLIEESKSLLLFSFSALLNVPMAHNVSVIVLKTVLSKDELAMLMAIPQIQSATIILYGKKQIEVIHSPIAKDLNLILKNKIELKKYIRKCIERKLSSL